MREATHLKGQQCESRHDRNLPQETGPLTHFDAFPDAWLTTIFYLTYLFSEFPSNFVMQRYPLGKTVSRGLSPINGRWRGRGTRGGTRSGASFHRPHLTRRLSLPLTYQLATYMLIWGVIVGCVSACHNVSIVARWSMLQPSRMPTLTRDGRFF